MGQEPCRLPTDKELAAAVAFFLNGRTDYEESPTSNMMRHAWLTLRPAWDQPENEHHDGIGAPFKQD